MTNSRKDRNELDVLIIGGGPAGLSALLWCNDLRMKALLLESGRELGGQLLHIYNPITNYPGRFAENGREMAQHFLASLGDISKKVRLNSKVVSFDANNVAATLESGEVLTARSAIIATGVRRRKLEIPGEEEFVGRGILESGARDRETVKGKRVAIIGGGDAALENALLLSEHAEKIHLIHRGDDFSARSDFTSSLQTVDNVLPAKRTVVLSVNGDDRLGSVSVRGPAGNYELNVDYVLIRIGVIPNTEIVRGQLELSELGYVMAEQRPVRNESTVLAVGDVSNIVAPTLSGAVGSAATAAKAIYRLICR